MKLLIADDDEILLAGLLKMDWEGQGFQLVGTAANGQEAYDLALRHCPDLILSDIQMPGMTGIELAKRMAELLPHCRMILLTGYDEFEYAREALKLRVADYILKGESREHIFKALKAAAAEVLSRADTETLSQKGLLLQRRNKLSNLLSPGETSGCDAASLGFDFDRHCYRLAVLRVLQEDALSGGVRPSAEGTINQTLMELCGDFFKERGKPDYFLSYQNYIAAFLELDGWDEQEAVFFWEALREKALEKKLRIAVGVGRGCDNWHSLPDSYDDAVFAAEEITLAGKREKTVSVYRSVSCPDCSQMKMIGEIRNYIYQNYGNKSLSLNEISEKLHISPAYISTLFKRYTDENFKNYLVRLRIKKACELLYKTNLCTYEIADQTGYPNSQYFSVMFKKHVGVSPTEYREQKNRPFAGNSR